jgi:hypothetical protein
MPRVLRYLIAGLLLGGVIVWLLFFEYKGYALGAALVVAFLCRLLVVEPELPQRRPEQDDR